MALSLVLHCERRLRYCVECWCRCNRGLVFSATRISLAKQAMFADNNNTEVKDRKVEPGISLALIEQQIIERINHSFDSILHQAKRAIRREIPGKQCPVHFPQVQIHIKHWA